MGLKTLSAALAVALWVQTAATVQTRRLVLENLRIIDGTGAAPIENARIVIDGDRIVRAGPSATTPALAGAKGA